MTRLFFWPSVSAIALSQAACGGDNTMTKHGDSMKIRLKVGDKALTATLIDGKTTQDFVSLLPLTLTMNDLFDREKFLRGAANANPDSLWTHCSLTCRKRSQLKGSGRTHTKSETSLTGLPALTSPSTISMTARRFPIRAGKLDSGVDAFNVPGSAEVKIEAMQE